MSREIVNAKLQERDERRQARDLTDFQAMLKHAHVRRQLWRVLAEAGTFASSFDADRPHMTSFNEGQRKVGNYLLAQIMGASPEAFAQMQREAASQQAEDKLFKEKLMKDHLEE
ncbi:MAG TPA: hypothetical protein VH309_02485 [Elusimicrobiota bacterium]|jgi:DNA polymerase III alpha subunit|nr:hypothetical protein [Elusimicrobiota bacterium]